MVTNHLPRVIVVLPGGYMGTGFVKKHKRKSLLAALLLIFQGRAKYLVMTLLVVATSLPFVFTSESFGRMLEIPAVAAVFRAMGLSGVISSLNLNPKYSSEFVKNVMDKAAADSAQGSYWSRLMGAVNSSFPGGRGDSGVSSLAMIKGGAELYKNETAKTGKKRPGPGEVAGVISAEEKARGEGAEVVDLEGVLGGGAGGPGAPGGSELYGDVMGANLADRYSGGSYDSAGPYVNRSLISRPGSIGDRKSGMYANAVNQASGKIPVPGRAKKVPAMTTGRASGFIWKNVGYKTQSATVEKKIGSKRPMFQLAETFSVGNSALKSKDSAPEYQAAYVGSTYDGNDINTDIIQTDANAPVLPESGFADTLDGVVAGQQLAEDCAKAQSDQGAKMSADADEMDRISQGASPPACYDNIGPWNAGVARQGALCQDFNANQAILSRACQTSNTPMDCSMYFKDTKSGGMVISKCKKPGGAFSIFMFLLMIVLFVFAVVAMILGPLIAFVVAVIVGYIAYVKITGMIAAAIAKAEALYKDINTKVEDAKSEFKTDSKDETKK